MPVVLMYRDGDVAQVNSDHAPTYDNFLAHGWTLDAPAPASEEVKVEVAAPEAADVPADEVEAPAPRSRKPAKA